MLLEQSFSRNTCCPNCRLTPPSSICEITRKNQEQVQKVLDVFMDKEIIEPSDLVEALGNEEEFDNLLKQAVDY